MKSSEITIGARLWTKIGGDRVEVEVVQKREINGRERWLVRRVDNGKILPKARAGSALHAGKYTTAPGAVAPSRPTCVCEGKFSPHPHDPSRCPAAPVRFA